MSGDWPPEWEDPEEEVTEGTDQSGAPVLDETAEARLAEVAACLASVPVPTMPDAVETRINAALAAEAAGSRKLGPPPHRARLRRRSAGRTGGRGQKGGDGRPRRGFPRPGFLHGPAAGVAVLVCVLLAGLGLALSSRTQQTESSAPAGSGAVNASAGSRAASSAESAAAGTAPRASASGPREGSASAASFAVTASGTRYQRATLAGQVRGRLAAANGGESPAPTAGSKSAAAAPSVTLRGCVLRVTGGAVPRLVDRATYQGEPAYVIASSARVWVVGPGCTAVKTELIVSVALAGLPGNLRALVSVEQ